MKIALFAIPVIIGWLSGWIVNYLADVLPATRRLSHPNCPQCGTSYTWTEYLLFQRCANCNTKRGLRVWIVQAIAIAGSLYLSLYQPGKIGYTLGMVVMVYLAMVFVIDLEHRLILHPTSLAGGILGLVTGSYLHGLIPTLLGGAAGFGIMLLLYWFGTVFTRFRARRMTAAGQETDDEEAMGGGDVYLGVVLGLILGWPLIWFGLVLGILLAGIISLIMVLGLIILRRYRDQALMVFIPYGPYLIASTVLLLYFPNWISTVVLT